MAGDFGKYLHDLEKNFETLLKHDPEGNPQTFTDNYPTEATEATEPAEPEIDPEDPDHPDHGHTVGEYNQTITAKSWTKIATSKAQQRKVKKRL